MPYNIMVSKLPGKKIAIVSRCAWTLYNFRSGLVKALKNTGAEVVCAGAGGDGFENKVRGLGVRFCHIPVDKRGLNPLADLKLTFTLYRWYKSLRPDLVHHFTIKPVIYGSVAARTAGVKCIVNTVTGLGHVFTDRSRRWLRSVVCFQYRMSLKCCHYVFFQNTDDANVFSSLNLVNERKTCILPGSGVDCNFFVPLWEHSSTDNGITFLMVARLLKEKGVVEYVEAARKIKKIYPDTKFLLLGRRDERNPSVIDAETLTSWQAEGTVSWMGEVEDVRPFVSRADVVVLPSYREGVPRSLLEAAAMGKPLIATDVPGCREIVAHGETGLLVQPRDSLSLAKAMMLMIERPQMRKNMGKDARRKVEIKFDERTVIEKVMRVYDHLFQER